MENKEHNLQDKRCECCGYMTYHREHMGCIRAAEQAQQAEPVAREVRNGFVTHDFYKTAEDAEEVARDMQKSHDLSGSIAAFNVRPVYAQPPAGAVPDSTYERKRFAKWFCMQDALKEDDASMDGYWAGWLARSGQPPAVPDGYALVPIKPTDLMLDAAVNAGDEPGRDYYTIYAAMLAAARKGGQ